MFKVQYLSIINKINAHETNTNTNSNDCAATSLMFKLSRLFKFQLRKWVGQRHRNSGPFPSSVIFVVNIARKAK